ncbi:MAG: hypothetical protein U0W65_12900 [Bacteroidia bacterium]
MRDLSSWSFMRILRLVAGAFAIVQAFITVDIVLGVLGLIVGGMALLNMGCCGNGACNTSYKKVNQNSKTIDVDYEEVVT